MISAETFQDTLYRADMGMVWLVITVGVLLVCGWRISRWPRLRPAIERATAWVCQPHPLLLILCLGVLVRIPKMFESFWYDEVFTARIATLPLDKFGPAVAGDVHPPLWYAIEWVTAQLLGASEPALRLPAFVLGLVVIVYAWRLARALRLSDSTAIWFAALVAILPAAIYYSVEARTYSLLALLAFGALIALLEDRPWMYLAHAALLPMAHNIGLVYLAVFTLIGILQWLPRLPGDGRRTVALALALIPGALWVPVMLQQSGDIADGWWLQEFNLGQGLGVITDMTVTRQLYPNTATVILGVAIAATLYGAWANRRWLLHDERGRMFGAFLFGVPVVLALASIVWEPVYLSRALLPIGIGCALLWALLLSDRPFWRLLVPATLVFAAAGLYTPPMQRFDMRSFIADDCSDAAGVYTTSITAALFSAYYMPNAELRMWANAGDLNQSLQKDVRVALDLPEGTPDDLPEPRCLLVLDTTATNDAEREHVAPLVAGARFMNEYVVNSFYTVRVYGLKG